MSKVGHLLFQLQYKIYMRGMKEAVKTAYEMLK